MLGHIAFGAAPFGDSANESGTVIMDVTGTGSLSLDVTLCDGSGTSAVPVFTGTSNLSQEALVCDGDGSHSCHGVGNLVLEQGVCAGVGEETNPPTTAKGTILHRYGGKGVHRRRSSRQPKL
jgi:hypothetical protein